MIKPGCDVQVGSGTDPAEGAALAGVLLDRLADTARLTYATSHHAQLKDRPVSVSGVLVSEHTQGLSKARRPAVLCFVPVLIGRGGGGGDKMRDSIKHCCFVCPVWEQAHLSKIHNAACVHFTDLGRHSQEEATRFEDVRSAR